MTENNAEKGYLFPHFTNDGRLDKEAVWFSVSYDGLNWIDLGNDEPILASSLGTTGVRDPFVLYDEQKEKYFIIATDLCTTKGGSWGDFCSKGSRSIVVWESKDLLSWSKERLVEVGIPEAGCVWAPEAVYCKEEKKWFVFWASFVKEEGDETGKQRIYGAFTDDFKSFTPTFKYMDAQTQIIDTNIVWSDGWYYRFSKDETNKVIILERCRHLICEQGEQYEKIHSDFLSRFVGLEGPEAFYSEKIGKWVLFVDQYGTGKGYLPLLCNDLSTGDFSVIDSEKYSIGKRKKRHGSILKIRRDIVDKLISHYGISRD